MTREEKILAAAEDLFFERSFDGVGMDAIGRSAGIVGSGIYRHFRSKNEILAALFDRATDALLLQIGEKADDPQEELANLIRAHVMFAVTHPKLAGIWVREARALAQPHRGNYLRRQRRYTDRWLECLALCYPARNRAELVASVLAVHGLITSDATMRLGSGRAPANFPDLVFALARCSLQALAGPIPGAVSTAAPVLQGTQ